MRASVGRGPGNSAQSFQALPAGDHSPGDRRSCIMYFQIPSNLQCVMCTSAHPLWAV